MKSWYRYLHFCLPANLGFRSIKVFSKELQEVLFTATCFNLFKTDEIEDTMNKDILSVYFRLVSS